MVIIIGDFNSQGERVVGEERILGPCGYGGRNGRELKSCPTMPKERCKNYKYIFQKKERFKMEMALSKHNIQKQIY